MLIDKTYVFLLSIQNIMIITMIVKNDRILISVYINVHFMKYNVSSGINRIIIIIYQKYINAFVE